MSISYRRIIGAIATVMMVGCAASGTPQTALPRRDSATASFVAPLTGQATAGNTPSEEATTVKTPTHPCPVGTQELMWVEPLTSPTDQLSQDVVVHIGNGEKITVNTESGTFTSGASPSRVTITLFPNTVHHLEVIAQVRLITTNDGCTYGGYTMRATHDRSGAPLVIVQGHPQPHPATIPITTANAHLLQQIGSITPQTSLTADWAFLTNDELVSIGFKDGIALWSANTGQELGRVGKEGLEGQVIATNVNKTLVATGGPADAPVVRLLDVQSGSMRELGSHSAGLTSIAFSPSGERLASGDDGDTVNVWDVNSGKLLKRLKGDVPQRLQRFSMLNWIDDDNLVAAGSDAIYWWKAMAGEPGRRVAKPPPVSFLVDVAFGDKANWLAAVAQDDALYTWDAATGEWSVWPAKSGSSLMHVEISPDGKLVAAGTAAGELQIWDTFAHKWLVTYSLRGSAIAAIRFSPDGRYITLGGWDSPIWLWGIP